MFLYARLVVDYLEKNIFFTVDEMKNSVDELPSGLTDLYFFMSIWLRAGMLTVPQLSKDSDADARTFGRSLGWPCQVHSWLDCIFETSTQEA